MAALAAARDNPWRRLPWSLPLSAMIALVALTGALRLLVGPSPPPPPAPLQVEVIAIPSPSPAIPAPPAVQEPPPEPRLTAEPTPKPAPPKPPPPRPGAPRSPIAAPIAPPPLAAPSPAPAGPTMGARALYKPMPEIPEALRHRNLALVAVARFTVATDGTATVELIEPTPDPALNRAILATLATWRFFPALSDGRPVASTVDIRIPITVK